MKKFLYILIPLGFVACQNQENTNSESEEKAEAYIAFHLDNLDTTASPCNDFYQYAIGGWLKENPIPSTESRWSSFNVVRDANNAKLKAILNDYASSENEAGSIGQQLGDFYSTALDSAKADQKGIEPLLEKMGEIDAISSKDEMISQIANLRTIGSNPLFGIYVGQDDKNSEQYITRLYQSGLGMPDRDYYLNSDESSKKIQDAYMKYTSSALSLANFEDAEALATKVYDIEKYLASKSMSRVERRDPEKTYNKFTTEELVEMSSNLNWELYFNAVGLKQVDEVIVSQPDFLMAVNKAVDSISMDDWKIYLKWRLLDSYGGYLSSDFVDNRFEFYGTALSGTKQIKPRWERSLNMVNSNLGELLGKAFVKQHFPEDAKENVSRMVENLREAFRERILALEWMSEETKDKAIEKLNSFNKKIGYPDKWRDYSELEVGDDLVSNIMNAREFNFAYGMNKLGKPVDRDEWFMSPQTVNAYYSSSKNEIVFPAGILQPPFFSYEADDAINYGGIGAVIGHEFTHGFDDQGSKYDAKGNLENWWTDEDRERFEERAGMVVDQFDRFEPIDSVFVNGKLTLGENIADLGGTTLAYYALLKEVGENNPAMIDGFDHKQRFFLGWAQVWHMNMTEEELRMRIKTDPHSPGQYRVIGPLANLNEFADAFGCVSGDAMVQADSLRAVIW